MDLQLNIGMILSQPKAFCKDCQNLDVNLGSLSDMILAGTPCSLTISLTNKPANLSIDIF